MKKASVLQLLNALIIISLFVASGCEKDPSNLGNSILPSSFQYQPGFANSSYIESGTDSAGRVSAYNPLYALIGNYSDPFIGTVNKAEFITQFWLSTSSVSFTNAYIDSVMGVRGQELRVESMTITMEYKGLYGSDDFSGGSSIIKIYELDDIEDSLTIYSDYSPSYNQGSILAEVTLTENSIYNDTIESKPYQLLSISLPISFGEKILLADEQYLASNTAFTDYIKGLYFSVEDNISGNILYFDLLSNQSKLTLTYSDTNLTSADAKSYDLVINSKCIRANLFQHEYSGEVFSDSAQSEFLHIQCMGGLRPVISFDKLVELWEDSGDVAIHNASLYLSICDSTDADVYPPPKKIYLFSINSDDSYSAITDYFDSSTIDGDLTDDNSGYHFNISRYIHEIISGKTISKGLFLYPEKDEYSANRAILYGSGSPENINLEISYTILP